MKQPITILCLLLFMMSSSCDILSPETDNDYLGYPTIFQRLSTSTLDSLETVYHRLNSDQFCGTVDSFGFASDKGCGTRDRESAIQKSEAVIMAKVGLLRNRQFTNITDTAALHIERAESNETRSIWVIRFKSQKYQDKTVARTQIRVFLNSGGVYNIYYHWYPEFLVPEKVKLNQTQARHTLIGDTLTYAGFGGEPHNVIITQETVSRFEAVQYIVPFRTQRGIEMRLTWRIPVGTLGDSPGWYIYVDAMTGEKIRTEQLFVT